MSYTSIFVFFDRVHILSVSFSTDRKSGKLWLLDVKPGKIVYVFYIIAPSSFPYVELIMMVLLLVCRSLVLNWLFMRLATVNNFFDMGFSVYIRRYLESAMSPLF